MPVNPNLYETVRLHLGEDPVSWIKTQKGLGRGYEAMARELRWKHKVVVSRMTMSRWDKTAPG